MSQTTPAVARRARVARSEAPVAFPIRAACVDCGSNAIRFLAAEFSAPTGMTLLTQERSPVRLGHGVFLNGRLAPGAMDEAIKSFARHRQLMAELGIVHYRAVATSAVRESKNGPAFLARVRKETGLELEIVNGSEEARLAHVAIRNRMNLGRERWVLVDLGGGSVEVSLVDDTGILWTESHTMGSVRLLEELSGEEADPGRFRRVLTEYVSTLRIPSAGRHQKPAGFIATGGNIMSLAKVAAKNPDAGGVSVLTLTDLRSAIERLSRLSFRQRVDELGLREDRADVILPAAMVYERLAVLAGADRIHVPHVGIPEGILLDLVDSLTSHDVHTAKQERTVHDAAVSLGRKYLFDEAHARHVATLAASLFDQLVDLHGLPPEDRRLLVASALLHDIGSFISNKKHHRHSHYLVASSDIAGLSPEEVRAAAVVARYHRKANPNPAHEEMKRLAPSDQDRVTKLAAILRVADALDREHRQAVRSVRARTGASAVTLHLEAEEDILLERFALKRRAQLFKKTFGLGIRIRAEENHG